MQTEELERDLKTLAEPRAEDERLRLAIRAALTERVDGLPTRRRPRVVVGSLVVAATVAIVALLGIGRSGGPSPADAAILARAARSLSPPANMIVHVRETGISDGTQVVGEWWQETNVPYALRLIKGPSSSPIEEAADGTTSSQYDPATNTIYQEPDSKSPSLVDPIETVRAELTNGSGHVAGTVTIGGQSLYKIEVPGGVVAYFDKTDYRPVYLDNPQTGGSVVRTHVTAYDELPLNAGNEKLLSIATQHPDAKVVSGVSPGPVGKK